MSYPPAAAASGGERRSRRHLALRAAFIAAAALALAGIVYSLAGTLGTTGSRRAGGGDTRTELTAGQSAIVQTEARAVIQVRIRTVAADLSAFTATVAGLAPGETGAWSAVLDDGSEAPLPASLGDDGTTVTVPLAGAVPQGRRLAAVRLDPDATAGDIYFDIKD
jgi:hypothetical protein